MGIFVEITSLLIRRSALKAHVQ